MSMLDASQNSLRCSFLRLLFAAVRQTHKLLNESFIEQKGMSKRPSTAKGTRGFQRAAGQRIRYADNQRTMELFCSAVQQAGSSGVDTTVQLLHTLATSKRLRGTRTAMQVLGTHGRNCMFGLFDCTDERRWVDFDLPATGMYINCFDSGGIAVFPIFLHLRESGPPSAHHRPRRLHHVDHMLTA